MGEITANSARGAGAFVDGCRDVRVLNRMTPDEGKRLEIENPRLFFRVYSDKGNMAPPSDRSDWHKLESIDLGNAADDRPGDHVQVVVPWEYPDAFDGVTTGDLLAVQKAIAEGEWRADSRASKWAGEAVATVLKISLENAADKERAKLLLKQWLKTGALKEVKCLDAGRKERVFIEVGQWAA